jgi:YD repeat-containing protein
MIAALLLLAGCGDGEDKSKPAPAPSYPIHKNAFRATQIDGHNDQWGDYTLLPEYNGEQLETVWRRDAAGDTVGVIRITRSDEWRIDDYFVDDYIPAISEDSIWRMDRDYTEMYGAGNYSLKDSIPMNSRTRVSCRTWYYTDSRIYQQEFMYYRPREDVGISGYNFDNSYIPTHKVRYLYEYGSDGRITVARWGEYTYPDPNPDPSRLTVFDTRQGKYEVSYANGRAASVGEYHQQGGGDFQLSASYTLSYSGERPASVTADGYTKSFAWSGNACTVTENGRTWKYTFDADLNPTRIEAPDGNVTTVVYERGSGDFEVLTHFFDRVMGSPYIK